VLCVTGVSGGGKGTVVTALRERHPGLTWSVSVTTRSPRAGECDGEDYVFVDDAGFDRLVADDALVEWAHVYDRRYGTPAAPIDDAIGAGRDLLIEVDVQGAEFVRARYPDAVIVALRPPDAATQRARLETRGMNDPADLERRLAEATDEMRRARAIGAYEIVNDHVDDTVDEVERLFFGVARK
jgi:guanylate kinase